MSAACWTCGAGAELGHRRLGVALCGAECRRRAEAADPVRVDERMIAGLARAAPALCGPAGRWRAVDGACMVPRALGAAIGRQVARIGPRTREKRGRDDDGGGADEERQASAPVAASSTARVMPLGGEGGEFGFIDLLPLDVQRMVLGASDLDLRALFNFANGGSRAAYLELIQKLCPNYDLARVFSDTRSGAGIDTLFYAALLAETFNDRANFNAVMHLAVLSFYRQIYIYYQVPITERPMEPIFNYLAEFDQLIPFYSSGFNYRACIPDESMRTLLWFYLLKIKGVVSDDILYHFWSQHYLYAPPTFTRPTIYRQISLLMLFLADAYLSWLIWTNDALPRIYRLKAARRSDLCGVASLTTLSALSEPRYTREANYFRAVQTLISPFIVTLAELLNPPLDLDVLAASFPRANIVVPSTTTSATAAAAAAAAPAAMTSSSSSSSAAAPTTVSVPTSDDWMGVDARIAAMLIGPRRGRQAQPDEGGDEEEQERVKRQQIAALTTLAPPPALPPSSSGTVLASTPVMSSSSGLPPRTGDSDDDDDESSSSSAAPAAARAPVSDDWLGTSLPAAMPMSFRLQFGALLRFIWREFFPWYKFVTTIADRNEPAGYKPAMYGMSFVLRLIGKPNLARLLLAENTPVMNLAALELASAWPDNANAELIQIASLLGLRQVALAELGVRDDASVDMDTLDRIEQFVKSNYRAYMRDAIIYFANSTVRTTEGVLFALNAGDSSIARSVQSFGWDKYDVAGYWWQGGGGRRQHVIYSAAVISILYGNTPAGAMPPYTAWRPGRAPLAPAALPDLDADTDDD